MDGYDHYRKRQRTQGIWTALIIVAVVAIFLMRQCGANNVRGTIPFSQMKYTRPDADLLCSSMDQCIEKVNGGSVFSSKRDAVYKVYSSYADFQTMYILAEVHHSQDLTDEFYREEYNFFMEKTPLVEKKLKDLLIACATCNDATRFEDSLFWKGFVEEYSAEKSTPMELVELKQKEGELISEYYNTTASQWIVWNGQKEEFPSIYYSTQDEAERKQILEQYYQTYNPILGDLYLRMIRLRSEIALAAGYDSYLEYAWKENFDRDYTTQQAKDYVNSVQQVMAPLLKQFLEEDGSRKIKSNLYACSTAEAQSSIRKITASISPKSKEIYQYLEKYDLFDLTVSDKKDSASYTTYISKYSAPYVFIDAGGSYLDVATFMHEFGHAADAYINYGSGASIDVAECSSISMELLTLSHMENCGESLQLFLRDYILYGILELFAYQGYLTAFELQVYSQDPDMLSLEDINRISLETSEQFGFSEDQEAEYSWIRINHLFLYPTYVVSYIVSADIALQIYDMELQNEGAGVETYFTLLNRGEEKRTFLEEVSRAGLQSPFEPGALEAVRKLLEPVLLYNDTGESSQAA